MSHITVYGGPSGSSLRVHWMLREVGQEYETKSVDFQTKEHKGDAFLAINPVGQIPAVVVDGKNMAESYAIAHYFAERFKPELLGATPEEREAAMQWALWAMLNVQKPMLDLAMLVWRKTEDEAVTTASNATLKTQLPAFENLLGQHAFVAGDTFTIGDLVACVTFTYGKMGGVDYSSYPNITRWMAACMARPAYVAATAK